MRSALQTTTSETDTSLEAYFRRILETQPVCLSRIAADGTFLAANDATLSLLGAERLDQILDTSLLTLVAPGDKEQCRQFLGRIINGDRGSTEVDLTGLGGLRHTLQIHGVALPGSPDGLAAAFCAFRDITEHRHLERALMDSAAREEQQSSALAQERERLNAALAQSRDRAAATATSAELARATALEAALADAEARHKDLAEQHASRQAQLLADFETAQQTFETSLTDQLGRIANAEAAIRDAEAREQALVERHDRDERAWKASLAQAVAEHEVQSGVLRQSIAALEASLAEVTAREQALVRARHEEDARWQTLVAESVAGKDSEIAALREAVARLEQTAREAEAARDEVIARYDADRASWMEKSAADRATADALVNGLQQQIETMEAMQSGHADERATLEAAAAEAEAARMQMAAQLAGAAAERQAADAELRGLARSARSGRLALALSGDLEEILVRAVDRGRRLLGSLAADTPERTAVEQWLAATCEAEATARRIRREAQPAGGTAIAGQVVQSLEPALGALLSPDIALSVLVGSPGARVDLSREQLEQLVLTLGAHGRTALAGGGQVSLEVADVDIDEACGRERGASPGAYVLIALHVAGSGVQAGLPDALVGTPASAEAWRAAGPGLGGAAHLAQSAGGHAWATREGPAAIAFEIYLPRVEAPPDEVTR